MSKPFRRNAASQDPLTRLWVLRTIEVLGVGRVAPDGLASLRGNVATVCGFGEAELELPALRRALRKRIEDKSDARPRGPVHRNAGWLAVHLGLGAVEATLLAFAARLHSEPALTDLFGEVRPTSVVEACRLIARIIDVDAATVRRALAADAPLAATGLVRLNPDLASGDEEILLVADGLLEVVAGDHRSPRSAGHPPPGRMLHRYFKPAPAAKWPLSAHAQHGDVLHTVVGLLNTALAPSPKKRIAGVNVLLHGEPGAGKTELARALAAAVSAELHVLAEGSAHRLDPSSDAQRAPYLLCQRVLAARVERARTRALVLVDETDALFARTEGRFMPSPREERDRRTALLDNNPVPALWITSDAASLEPSFLQGFDLVVEVRPVPVAARRRLVDDVADRLHLSADTRARLSVNEDLSPALLARAERVAGLMGVAGEPADRVVDQVVTGVASATGKTRPARRRPSPRFDAELVHTEPPALPVVAGLVARRSGSVLLHGLPGTGKTELVRHAAAQAGVPLVVKRASELLNMYLGGTEKKLAEMFEEAREQHAFLLLDEADSFLQDRRGAVRSWEVTQVNELLVQMESFDGVFFCATNFIEKLDTAALRRFDVKLRFLPLTADGRRRSVETFTSLSPTEQVHLARIVAPLEGLCIGDVVSVWRGLALGPADVEEMGRRLKAELAMRRQPALVGFR
ncbi:MAG: AAA family ATPase [Deltaproteobacteria bacterium]|nr:AAA family ATPase [Deltaproteobacteria bacterium]